jgi:small-conductance mechanosensitive channel
MRALSIGFITLAIANVVAVAGVLGWLKASDRLSKERIHAIRVMFSEPVAAEVARNKAAAAEAEKAKAAAEAQAQAEQPPVSAEQRSAIIREYEEKTRQEKLRLQRETESLLDTLTKRQEQFEADRAAFRAEKDAFEKQRAELERLEGDEQFQKSLKVYQSLKPEESKAMLAQLLTAGKTADVVTYLNAMKPSIATRIVSEFQKGDPKLAADLLERLRVHGLAVATP